MHDEKKLEEYELLPYRMEVFFDSDSSVWVVRYPELPGCTAHGDSPEDAMALGKQAKALWLETAVEERQNIPRPQGDPAYSGKLVLRLPKTLHEAAVNSAEREGVSLNQYLVAGIAFWVGAGNLSERISSQFQQRLSPQNVVKVLVVAGSTTNISGSNAALINTGSISFLTDVGNQMKTVTATVE